MGKIISFLVLNAVFYMVVADGMMVHFNFGRDVQYIFNFAGIFFVCPFCLSVLLDMSFIEEKEWAARYVKDIPRTTVHAVRRE